MKQAHGYIEYFDLEDWWLSEFTYEEREYIDGRYQPMGLGPGSLTTGHISETTSDVTSFLSGLSTWFRSKDDRHIAKRIHQKIVSPAEDRPVSKPGYIDGRHYSTYIPDIKGLKAQREDDKLEAILWELIKATEAQHEAEGFGPAPSYYRELAILYRKQEEYAKEVDIIERFAQYYDREKVRKSGAIWGLLERLDKAKMLLERRSN